MRKVETGRTFAYLRVPPGKGPFPAVIFYQGTLDRLPEKRLKEIATGRGIAVTRGNPER